MSKLAGKVVLITGAGRLRGIGRATALRLADEGADIVVSASRRDPSQFPQNEKEVGWKGSASVAEEVRAKGRRALAFDCDVTKRPEVEDLMAATIAEFGRLDAIINNAGTASGAGANPIIDMDDEVWYRTVDINLNGVYLVSKLGAREMIKAGNGGSIINISSMAGRVGMANYGAYCATKFGVIGLTQQMALELARKNIRVNCLCPGSTDSDMMDGTFQRLADRSKTDFDRIKTGVAKSIPLGRQGHVDEQASVISFLIGPDSSFMTGQTLNVDGGARMD